MAKIEFSPQQKQQLIDKLQAYCGSELDVELR